MTTIEVLAGSAGSGDRNDEKDVKLVRQPPDHWLAREAFDVYWMFLHERL